MFCSLSVNAGRKEEIMAGSRCTLPLFVTQSGLVPGITDKTAFPQSGSPNVVFLQLSKVDFLTSRSRNRVKNI